MRQKEIFGKIFWDKRERVEDYTVTFIHRGAPGDQKTILCTSFVNVAKSWFTYRSDEEETLIPFHRILEIKNLKTGKVLWRKVLK
ncbi:MAG: RNA repair domain-containing protein [Candidatus Bathyarchaeota archaeon]